MNSAKLQGTKLIYRNLWCLYTQLIIRKRNKKMPFATPSKRIKYHVINLTSKTLETETKED